MQVVPMAKHPLVMEKPTAEVVVPEVPPRMLSDWTVVVPLAVILKAEADDVALPDSGVAVAR